MPELTRRRSLDAPDECWHVYYGDVRVGTIAIRTGMLSSRSGTLGQSGTNGADRARGANDSKGAFDLVGIGGL